MTSYAGLPTGHALITSIIDKAVQRFQATGPDQQEELRDRMDAFSGLYS